MFININKRLVNFNNIDFIEKDGQDSYLLKLSGGTGLTLNDEQYHKLIKKLDELKLLKDLPVNG